MLILIILEIINYNIISGGDLVKLKVDFFNAYVIKLDEDHWLDFNIINSPKLAIISLYYLSSSS